MTREEAKRFEWFRNDRDNIYNHIEKIYDDVENMKCENCKWIQDEICTNGNSTMYSDYPVLEMCCNKWGEK